MRTLLTTIVMALALTVQGQAPVAGGFNKETAVTHWHQQMTPEGMAYFSEVDTDDLNRTWIYLPEDEMFMFLFSEDSYGYRVAIREFDKLQGRIINNSFFPGYVDSYRDYNAVNIAVGARQAEIVLQKNFGDNMVAVLVYSPDSAFIMVK